MSTDLESLKDALSGVVTDNEENKQFSDNIKAIIDLYALVDGYMANLRGDNSSLRTYYEKLQVLKRRGFKVANAIARLKYQIESTEISIQNLDSQRVSSVALLKNDLLELTRTVLQYRIVIDDKEDGALGQFMASLEMFDSETRVTTEDVLQLVHIALSHLHDLQDDVYKFDPQIAEATQMKARNFDVGDLVETLELQRRTTQEKHVLYSNFFVDTSAKHLERVQNYIKELADKAQRIKEAAKDSQKVENSPVADPNSATSKPAGTGENVGNEAPSDQAGPEDSGDKET